MDNFDSDDDYYDYENDIEDYQTLEPSHLKFYNPLTEPEETPIEDLKQAIIAGDVSLVGRLLKIVAPHSELNQTNVMEENRDDLLGQDILEYDICREIMFSDGWTPLILAAHYGLWEMVDIILNHPFHVDYRGKNCGLTPLLAACASKLRRGMKEDVVVDHNRVVTSLVEAGAQVDARAEGVTSQGYTALHFAASTGRFHIIDILINAGADINITDNQGRSPLMVAAEAGHIVATNVLIQRSANLLQEDFTGRSASCMAAMAGNSELADTLSVLSGEARGDTRLYKVWALIRETLNESNQDFECISIGGQKMRSEHFYDELASLCYGLDLGHLLPLFRDQGVTVPDLLKISDTKLQQIGVEKFQDRKRILDLVQDMHKRPWKDEDCLLKFDYGKPIKPSDLINMMGCTSRHLEFMDATISYLENHIRENHRLYLEQTGGVQKTIIEQLGTYCKESLDNSARLYNSLRFLHQCANEFHDCAVVDVFPDLIIGEDDIILPKQKSSLKQLFKWTVCGSVVAGVSYFTFKRLNLL